MSLSYEDDFKTFLENLEEFNQTAKSNGIKLIDYITKNIAYDLNTVLEVENIDQVSLYGFSFGTWLALQTAKDYPKKVKKLIFDGTVLFNNSPILAGVGVLKKLNDLSKKYENKYNEDFKKRVENIFNSSLDKAAIATIINMTLPLLAYKDEGVEKAKKILDTIGSDTYQVETKSKKHYDHSFEREDEYFLDEKRIFPWANAMSVMAEQYYMAASSGFQIEVLDFIHKHLKLQEIIQPTFRSVLKNWK